MIPQNRQLRFQWMLLAGAVLLLLIYRLAYVPLATNVGTLDKSLVAGWDKLLTAARGNPAVTGLDAPALTASTRELEKSLTAIQQAGRAALARVEPDPATKALLNQPFQLLDFDKSMLEQVGALRRLAAARKVAVEESVYANFPAYQAGFAKPALLWAQLACVQQLLTTAVVQEPRMIKSLSLLPQQSHVVPGAAGPSLEEFPVRLEVFGSLESVTGLLRSLPLRSSELESLGCRAVTNKTQALFVDRLVLKNTTNNPAELHLDLIVSGYVPLEPASTAATPAKPAS